MIKTVVLESSYYGADEEFEFEVNDNATEEEIEQAGLETILSNIRWYVKRLRR